MMLAVLTGFFLAYGEAHWGWWILFWLAFFSHFIIVGIAAIIGIASDK